MRILATILSFLMLDAAALAHPHVFVDVRGSFVLDDRGRLTAVRIHWQYDAFTTLILYDTLGLDRDGDGVLDASDLQKVKTGETDWAPDYEGDTYLFIGDEKVQLSRPRQAEVHPLGDRIGVSFTLDLDSPAQMRGKTANLQLYDPIYYYAYSITPDSGMIGSTEGCTTHIASFEPTEETLELQDQLAALSREETPENQNIGALFAEYMFLTCV